MCGTREADGRAMLGFGFAPLDLLVASATLSCSSQDWMLPLLDGDAVFIDGTCCLVAGRAAAPATMSVAGAAGRSTA